LAVGGKSLGKFIFAFPILLNNYDCPFEPSKGGFPDKN